MVEFEVKLPFVMARTHLDKGIIILQIIGSPKFAHGVGRSRTSDGCLALDEFRMFCGGMELMFRDNVV